MANQKDGRSLQLDLPVLVVDDSATVRRIVASLLGQLGFAVIDEAGAAAEALEKLKKRSYQLCICDWYMDGIDGLEFAKQAKALAGRGDLKVLLMSGEAGVLEKAANSSIDDFISKPFTSQELRRKLQFMLNLKLQ